MIKNIRTKLQYYNILRYVIADQKLTSNNNNVILRASSNVKDKYIMNKIKDNNYTVINPKDATLRKI